MINYSTIPVSQTDLFIHPSHYHSYQSQSAYLPQQIHTTVCHLDGSDSSLYIQSYSKVLKVELSPLVPNIIMS